MTPLIVAEKVWVRRPFSEGQTLLENSLHDKIILEDVSLTLTPRKITTLIGPNGAGKTTLLKVLLGLVPVSSGTIRRKINLKTGYMPQKLSLNPTLPLTVEGLLGLGVPQRLLKLQSLIDHCLNEVGAGTLKMQRLGTLSGGEMQRVMLARALMTEPEILVLDEPMQGVDVLGQEELYQLIARLRDQRGCAVLLVSHDLHLVMAASDEVICLNTHICCSGHPRQVSADPHYQKLFVRPYQHQHDHRHDDSRFAPFSEPQDKTGSKQHPHVQEPDHCR